MTTLHELWEYVTQGQGQIVNVEGAPGVGKSRLVSELRTRLQGQALSYVAATCSTYGYPMPYRPIRDIVRQCCGITEMDSSERVRSNLHQRLDDLGLGAEEHVAYLAHLFALPSSTTHLRPQNLHLRIVNLWRQLTLAHSAQQPLLLLLEEVDQIDTASISCLRALLETLSDASILLITTRHAGEPPAWLDKPTTTSLALGPLTPEAVLPLARTHMPAPRWLASESRRFLAIAGGNPFFILDLAREVEEQVILGADPVWPTSIQESLTMRLNRLQPEPRLLLQYAAVMGPSFSLSTLQSVWQGTGDCRSHLLELE